jgi:hypothetical protein
MVIRILTGKDVAGSVRYNEQKVGEGQAERIHIANYPDRQIAEKSARCRLQLLEQQARLNPAISKPAVHLAIAFHPDETLTDDRLRQIGKEVMTEAGYGTQPYLIYRHDDTSHPHMHVVTVSVDANGRHISDRFIRRRLNAIRAGIEQRHALLPANRMNRLGRVGDTGHDPGVPGNGGDRPVAEFVGQTLSAYSFGSVESLRLYLAGRGVRMNTSAGRSGAGITFQQIGDTGPAGRPVRASDLTGQPTHRRLSEHVAAQADRHRTGRDNLATAIGQRLSRYESLTEAEFMQVLRQGGIEVRQQEGHYLYVQERPGLVVLDSELPPAFNRLQLTARFGETTVRRSAYPEVTGQWHSAKLAPTQQVNEPTKLVQPQAKPPVTRLAIQKTVKPDVSPKLPEKAGAQPAYQEMPTVQPPQMPVKSPGYEPDKKAGKPKKKQRRPGPRL